MERSLLDRKNSIRNIKSTQDILEVVHIEITKERKEIKQWAERKWFRIE